jgi:hypothetical protein
MKTISKLIAVAFTATALFFTTNAKAQTTPADAFRFSIGLESGIPTGNLRIGSNFSLGGTARIQYGVTDNFALTLTSGAFHFLSKDIPGTNTKYDSFGVIPIKAGVKEFFVPNFYVGAEAGVGIEETDSGVGNTKLILSPALGYANKHWDVGFHYESFTGQNDPYGLVALRIAYGFKL